MEKKAVFSEFPPIGLLSVPKRTKSWTNLTHSMATLKISDHCDPHHSADSLQMKLSLKKQIWTGAWNESAMDRTRPLSWGVSSGNMALKSTSQYLEVKEYDSEQLLIACSRKLEAWQENGNRQQKQQQQGKQKSHKTIGNHHGKKLNRDDKSQRLQKGFHVSTASFINRCNITRISELGGKTRKTPQSYALVETTDFITSGLGRSTFQRRLKGGSVAVGQKKILPQSNLVGAGGGQENRNAGGEISRRGANTKKNKFKTGGIVVTAVQKPGKPTKKVAKRTRAILPPGRSTSDAGLAV